MFANDNLGQSSVGVVKGSFSRDSSESESTMCRFFGVLGFWFWEVIFNGECSPTPLPTHHGVQQGGVQSCGNRQVHTRDTGTVYSSNETEVRCNITRLTLATAV